LLTDFGRAQRDAYAERIALKREKAFEL